ncbi:MAG: elongation factor P maturation arginine rhamnosyltransferase EarP [Polaromonas sp.]|nr:elongation factor P maturation arginine rhamnosyltransferase EarP [Polaromonas sp.]
MGSLQWDIFCKVIDNFGDIGVCWRLCKDLASRGHKVRLWVDDPSALDWMAPDGCKGVQLMPWTHPLNLDLLDAAPTEVLIEAFGCEIAPDFIAACVRTYWAGSQNDTQNSKPKPVWINLEYLTAESQAERNHAMPSPVHIGPAAGWIKWFFYPGFTPKTGGLLREPGLAKRQAAFDRSAWLGSQDIDWHGETLVSLFCYEPPALPALLAHFASEGINGQPVRLLVAAGRAEQAARAAFNLKITQNTSQIGPHPNKHERGLLSISYLSLLDQVDFDHLLWACDINFVRGEDSVIRALWAGKPFVWQIYPQDDEVHHAKLEAFLDMLAATLSLRALHQRWNAGQRAELDSEPRLAKNLGIDISNWSEWQQTVQAARASLLAQNDLTSRLLQFVAKNR